VTLAPLPAGPVGRVVFLGTPDEAAVVLRRLVADGVEVVAAVTRPDARRGRGPGRSPSPVKIAATDLGVAVSHDHDETLRAHPGVLGVVVAYGRIFSDALLERHALINLHFSLLPRWRGAAPVERALLAGDTETGVCLMRITSGLDEGDVYDCVRVPIGSADTATTLRSTLADAGADLLSCRLATGLGSASAQAGEATYAAKITAVDRTIDWAESAVMSVRRVRLGAARAILEGDEVRVHSATIVDAAGVPGRVLGVDRDGITVACGVGALRLERIQSASGREMAAADWWRGRR
jgi:methionyl-tRNA formyltransferase